MNDVTGDRRTHWREIIAGVLEWNYSHLRLESSSCFSIIVRVITFSLFKAKIVSPSQHRFKLWGFISFKAKSREKRLNISINSIMHAKSKKTLWFVFMLTSVRMESRKGPRKEIRSENLNFIMAGACPKIYCICGKLPEVWVSMNADRRRVRYPEMSESSIEAKIWRKVTTC